MIGPAASGVLSPVCSRATDVGPGFDSRLCWQSTYSDVDPAIAAWLSRIEPSALLVGPRCCSLAPMEEAYNARVADVPLSRADRRELWKRLHDSATSVASSVLHDDESDAAPAPRQMHTAVSVAEVEEAPPARSMHNSADSAGHEDASADEHASGLVRTAVAEVEVAAPVEAEAAALNIPCQNRSGSSTERSAPCAWTRPSLRYTGPASADTASVKFAATVCYRRAMSYVLSVEPRSRRTFVSSMCCSLGLHSNAMPLPRMSAELWRRTSTPSASGPTGHTSSAQSKRGVSERCWRCFVARIRQVPDGAGTIGVSF